MLAREGRRACRGVTGVTDAMFTVKRICEHPPDGGSILGAAGDGVSVRRYRRPDGIIYPVMGGDGRDHITVSLSRDPVVEKTIGRSRTVRRIMAGDVSIDHADTSSRYRVSGPSDIVQVSLSVRGSAASRKGTLLSSLNEPEPDLETLAYRVAQAIWLGEAEDPLFLSTVFVRGRELLERRSMRGRGGLSARQARLVDDLIKARIADPEGATPTLTELASAVDRSVFHFSRAFKRTFGISPYKFVLRQRLARARDLIVEGRENLQHVSEICKFSSVQHLTATFGREMGVTPARLRTLKQEMRRCP